MKISVINGPNINMLGIREKDIYGSYTYNDMIKQITDFAHSKKICVDFFQSNHEGDIIDYIQSLYQKTDAIIINPAAYTHTSIAIPDALKAVQIKTVEVHLSDISKREDYRKKSYVSEYAIKTIAGYGINGYIKAIEYLISET